MSRFIIFYSNSHGSNLNKTVFIPRRVNTHTHEEFDLNHNNNYKPEASKHRDQGNCATYDNLDEPWGHYYKLNMSVRKRQILYDTLLVSKILKFKKFEV